MDELRKQMEEQGYDCAYILNNITRVSKDGKWYFLDKTGILVPRYHFTEEEYYATPAYMHLSDIEDLIKNLFLDYQDKIRDNSELIRCLYSVGDSFYYNEEGMDLSRWLREELEEFVFSLWGINTLNIINRELLMKVILDFQLQKSYERIMGSMLVPNLYDTEIKSFLEEVLNVNGMNIQGPLYFQ